jgi:hypothetical protein
LATRCGNAHPNGIKFLLLFSKKKRFLPYVIDTKPHAPPHPHLTTIIAAFFLALGLYGAQLGWATDRDSLRVIDAARAILQGHYQRSRSFGFPLHEAASAVCYAVGGLRAVNLGTLAVTLAGLVVVATVIARYAASRIELGMIALAFSPLLLTNATAAIDFGWDFAAGMVLLLAALNLQRAGPKPLPRHLAAYAAATLALILLRPDNGLFAAAVTLALMLPPTKLRWPVAAVALAAATGAASLYILLNGPGMFATAVTTARPWPARLARAAVLLSAALGPGGVLALCMLPAAPVQHEAQAPVGFLRRATLFCWLLYLPRFAALPDQVEYLILPVSLTALLAATTLALRPAWLVTALIVLPSLVTVSLLQRNGQTGALQWHIAPQWGALPQDWAARRFANTLASPAMETYIAAQSHLAAALVPDTYLPGYISPQRDLVIAHAQLFHIMQVPHGAPPTVPRRWYRAIFACRDPLGPGIGWRGWEAPAATTVVSLQATHRPEPCGLMDNAP